MAQPRRFRAALVGCGRISEIHIAALKDLPDVDVVAVCDLNERLAGSQALRHQIPGVYTDTGRLLSELRPDVLHLLTPPQTHAVLARLAAEARAHLYVEKPLASNEADARSVVEATREAGVYLCTGHSLLFEPIFRKACERIAAGEIGHVVSVRAEQGFTYESAARSATIPWSYTYDWGIFENLMPHPLYLACHFLTGPGEPKVIGLNLGRIREAAVEEIRVLIPSLSAIAEVSLSLSTSPEIRRLEVVGTRGRLLVDFATLTLLSTRENDLPSAVNRFTSNFRTAASLTRAGASVIAGIASGNIRRYMGIRALVTEFYASLRSGGAPPVLPEAGLLNVRLMDQIRNACAGIVKRRVAEYSPAPTGATSRTLVTGASGFLGRHLVERLSSDRVSTRAATRLLSRARPVPGVEWVRCDITRPEDLRKALGEVETIFHCAAMTDAPGSLGEYDNANVKATLALAELATEIGVKNLIYVSSLGVYGSPDGHTPYLDESTPYDRRAGDRGPYTQSKLAADKALLEYAASHTRPRIVVLRAGSIYGPGAKVPTGRLQLPCPIGRPLIAGGSAVPIPLVYVDNFVDAMLAAARSAVPTGNVYNIVDSPDLDQGALARTLREASRGRIRPVFVPYPLVWLLMLGVDLLSLLRTGSLGTARFRLNRTLANMRFQCLAARRDLGWAPRVPLPDGIARAIEPQRRVESGAFPARTGSQS